MFNPTPRIEALHIAGRHHVYVVDDALQDPHALVDYAATHADAFRELSVNGYPGPELRMPESFSAQLDAFVATHFRARCGVRRTVRMYSRLALTLTPPAQLAPGQSICHIDRLNDSADQRVLASVLYLFQDPRLGGTSFYAPKRPPAEIIPLIDDAGRMDAASFEAKYGIAPGYMTASNAWFEKLLTVPARFNRLIVYEGTLFHSGEIAHPELLDADPRRGRLSLNGFFICKRSLAA